MSALDPKLEQKLQAMRSRYEELGRALSEPDVVSDLERYRTASKAYADLRPVVAMHEEYGKVASDLAGARELLAGADDPEMKAMAEEEVAALSARAEKLEQDLKVALLPVDPNDAKNVVLEILIQLLNDLDALLHDLVVQRGLDLGHVLEQASGCLDVAGLELVECIQVVPVAERLESEDCLGKQVRLLRGVVDGQLVDLAEQ